MFCDLWRQKARKFPPIFAAAGWADQSSRILPILGVRGLTAKNQDQVLEERKSIFLRILSNQPVLVEPESRGVAHRRYHILLLERVAARPPQLQEVVVGSVRRGEDRPLPRLPSFAAPSHTLVAPTLHSVVFGTLAQHCAPCNPSGTRGCRPRQRIRHPRPAAGQRTRSRSECGTRPPTRKSCSCCSRPTVMNLPSSSSVKEACGAGSVMTFRCRSYLATAIMNCPRSRLSATAAISP